MKRRDLELAIDAAHRHVRELLTMIEKERAAHPDSPHIEILRRLAADAAYAEQQLVTASNVVCELPADPPEPAKPWIDPESIHDEAGGKWLRGTVDEFSFAALVLPQHARVRSWEIGDSCIETLTIRRRGTKRILFNWDRGPNIPTTDARVLQAIACLEACLRQTAFPDAPAEPPAHDGVIDALAESAREEAQRVRALRRARGRRVRAGTPRAL